MNTKNIAGFVLLALAITSCNQKTEGNTKAALPAVQAVSPVAPAEKQILTEVKIQSDTTQSYFLYVPSTADSNSLLLVFFDPGAKGKKPVEKYQSLAERHGIILAGSNNSKNGLSGEESAALAKKFVQDAQKRCGVKRKHTIACGFSGGARVAVLTAIGENLPAVIGCGAGFPGKPDKNLGFSYIGMVGNEDFNYLEMKRLYQDLDRIRMNHQLLIFDGKHEWAPENEMEKALLLLKTDTQSAAALAATINNAAAAYQKNKEWLRLYDELRLGITSGLDSAYTKQWHGQLRLLKKNTACVTELKTEAEIETKEAAAQSELANAFAERNFTLLSEKIKSLKKETAGKSTLEKLSAQRLLQFTSLMSFLYSEKALGMDASLAKKYLDIYGQADSGNHDYHFLLACYYAKTNDKPKSLSSLEKAVELGFDDAEKLRDNSYLKALAGEARFTELLQKFQ